MGTTVCQWRTQHKPQPASRSGRGLRFRNTVLSPKSILYTNQFQQFALKIPPTFYKNSDLRCSPQKLMRVEFMPQELLIVLFFCYTTIIFLYVKAAHILPARERAWFPAFRKKKTLKQLLWLRLYFSTKFSYVNQRVVDTQSFGWYFSQLRLLRCAGGPHARHAAGQRGHTALPSAPAPP